jgi:hypothetical protein
MKKMIKRTICIALILCMTMLWAPGTLAQAATIKISQTKLSLTVGKSKTLKIQNTTKAATWSSNNKKVAKVTKSGKVTAVSTGTATITATVSKKTYSCKVTVKPDYKFSVNVIDSLHAEFRISGLELKEKSSGTSADTTGYTYELAFDKYTVTLQHTGKHYKVIDAETGLIELDGISCFTAYNEGGEKNIYTEAETYYKNNTLIIELHYSLNYSSMDLCKTTQYQCKISTAGKVVSEKNATTEAITYIPVEATFPIEYDLKATMLDAKTMELRLTDSSLQERYIIDRTESAINRGELSWTINFKSKEQGYSIALYRSAPVVGQNRIVSPDSLYLSFTGAELDEEYNKMKGGEAYEDPVLMIDGKTLIFKCTLPDNLDISKLDGFAISVVNQAIGLTGGGTVYEASKVLE